MTAIRSTSWAWWLYWQQSILLKVGALFILLSFAVCTYLITASNLSGELTGVSKAIEQAGTERMRVYKLAYLIDRSTRSEQERASIREEMSHFERVMEGLRLVLPSTIRLHRKTTLSRLSLAPSDSDGRHNSNPILIKF